MPALPLDEAGKYVAAAYLVFFALILIYIGIIGARFQRINREMGELAEEVEARRDSEPAGREAPPPREPDAADRRGGPDRPDGPDGAGEETETADV